MKTTGMVPPDDIALIRSSPLFDARWYLGQYPDVEMLGLDPAEHFLWLGSRIGRDPSPDFSTQAYLEANPDVKAAGVNPLLHYLRHGRNEARAIVPAGRGAARAGRLP